MQLGNAIDVTAAEHAQVRHTHLTTLDDCKTRDEIGIARILLPDTLAETAVDGLDDAVNSRQQALHGVRRPLLERLGHDRVVRVVERALGDVDRFLPREVFLVDENADELGDGKRRVRVVDLDGNLVGQGVQIAVVALVRINDRLHRRRNEEVELAQAQLLTTLVAILGIKHLRDRLRQLALGNCSLVLTLVEARKVDLLRRASTPQAQRCRQRAVIADDGHVPRLGKYRVGAVLDDLQLAVFAPELFDRAAELDLEHAVSTLSRPNVTAFEPSVGRFDLLAVVNLLAEETVLIANATTHGRHAERREAVEKAGRQTAETAIAKACVSFLLLNITEIVAHLRKRCSIGVIQTKVHEVVRKGAPDEKLSAQVDEAFVA